MEFASVLARDVRMGAIGGEQALAVEALFWREVVGEVFYFAQMANTPFLYRSLALLT